MKGVRKGSWYRYNKTIAESLFNPGLADRALVQVVNVPGGARTGAFRNVRDQEGNTYFVHISSLEGPKSNPNKFIDLYR